MEVLNQLDAAVDFIRSRCSQTPDIGLVLGSGLGDVAGLVAEPVAIPFAAIPHFIASTVPGHGNSLLIGRIAGRMVALLQGRSHYYEGHDIAAVVFPVRVLRHLGCRTIILTNAAGAIGAHLAVGDLMVIRDHINLLGVNPLRGENDERLGPRFLDMSAVYDPLLRELFLRELRQLGLKAVSGVYAALAGPCYETPAEVRMLAHLGVDAVGMSTVPEAIAARHMGARLAGVSCISNLAAGISPAPLAHEEVTAAVKAVNANFNALLTRVVPQL